MARRAAAAEHALRSHSDGKAADVSLPAVRAVQAYHIPLASGNIAGEAHHLLDIYGSLAVVFKHRIAAYDIAVLENGVVKLQRASRNLIVGHRNLESFCVLVRACKRKAGDLAAPAENAVLLICKERYGIAVRVLYFESGGAEISRTEERAFKKRLVERKLLILLALVRGKRMQAVEILRIKPADLFSVIKMYGILSVKNHEIVFRILRSQTKSHPVLFKFYRHGFSFADIIFYGPHIRISCEVCLLHVFCPNAKRAKVRAARRCSPRARSVQRCAVSRNFPDERDDPETVIVILPYLQPFGNSFFSFPIK